MNKLEKYELKYLNLTWAFIVFCTFYISITNFLGGKYHYGIVPDWVDYAFLAYIVIANFIKQILLKRGFLNKFSIYMTFRVLELICLSFLVLIIGIGQWAFGLLVFPVTITTLCKGKRFGLAVVTISILLHTSMLFLIFRVFDRLAYDIQQFDLYQRILTLSGFYAVSYMFALLCATIYKETNESQDEKNKLLEEIADKYSQIEAAQNEIQNQYGKLKESNIKLEETNKRLTHSIAEFYTLQQISEAISSLLDINELLKFVNDIIIGVMGVNNSSIILFDERKNRLKLQSTNIKNKEELVTINDNINSKALMNVLYEGKPIIENFVDHEEYPFTKGRDVNSLVCVPLNSKSRKFGLVLIEHKYFNAFDEENMRLLDTIGKQVGIAMENAELYHQIQDLATRDGLTGIYNKHFFHKKMSEELKKAREEKYSMSLAIFDIDHFKRFNDTFGHLFGDEVLKSTADLISNSLRSTDLFARFGGEEFIIIFSHTTLQEAYEKVEKLRGLVEQNIVKDNLVTASVTVSFGVAAYPETSFSETELIRHADDALYAAKRDGRNCVRIARSI